MPTRISAGVGDHPCFITMIPIFPFTYQYLQKVAMCIHFDSRECSKCSIKLKPTISSVILQYKTKWHTLAYWDVPFRITALKKIFWKGPALTMWEPLKKLIKQKWISVILDAIDNTSNGKLPAGIGVYLDVLFAPWIVTVSYLRWYLIQSNYIP